MRVVDGRGLEFPEEVAVGAEGRLAVVGFHSFPLPL